MKPVQEPELALAALLIKYVRETTGMASSALAKGESLHDTARVLSSYADIITMRHPDAFSVEEF